MMTQNPSQPGLLALSVIAVLGLSACGGGGGGSNNDAANNAGDGNTGGDQNQTAMLSVAAQSDTAEVNAINGITYAADGRIYAVGYSNNDTTGGDRGSVLFRFNADGSPDQTFGGGSGFVEYNLSVAAAGGDGGEQPFGVVELANGDLIMVVNINDGNGDADTDEGSSVILVRVDRDGQVVDTWGDGGEVEVVFGWANADNAGFPDAATAFPSDFAYDLALDTSGGEEKLVVFGYGPAAQGTAGAPTDRDRYVTRLLASDGSVDPAFNGGSAFTFSTPRDGGTTDNGRRGIVEADGSILSAGYTNLGDGFGNYVILIRLRADGSLDTGFGDFIAPAATSPSGIAQPGVAVFNPLQPDSGFAEAYAAVPLSNGDYVTTGYGRATGGLDVPSSLGFLPSDATDLVVFRVVGNALDAGFGINGNAVAQSEGEGRASSEERGRDMVALADDRTVHVGRYAGEPAIYVYTADGELDSSVDNDGIIELPHSPMNTAGPVTEQFFTAELNADGSQIAIGTRGNDAAGARLVLVDVQ